MSIIKFIPFFALVAAPMIAAAVYSIVYHLDMGQQNGLLLVSIPVNMAWVCLLALIHNVLGGRR